jgi:hypothetical protein
MSSFTPVTEDGRSAADAGVDSSLANVVAAATAATQRAEQEAAEKDAAGGADSKKERRHISPGERLDIARTLNEYKHYFETKSQKEFFRFIIQKLEEQGVTSGRSPESLQNTVIRWVDTYDEEDKHQSPIIETYHNIMRDFVTIVHRVRDEKRRLRTPKPDHHGSEIFAEAEVSGDGADGSPRALKRIRIERDSGELARVAELVEQIHEFVRQNPATNDAIVNQLTAQTALHETQVQRLTAKLDEVTGQLEQVMTTVSTLSDTVSKLSDALKEKDKRK